MAARYNVEPAKLLSTLKNTAFKGATDDQMLALVVVANEHGLNPFTREIYAFPDKAGGIVPVVGIDGWIRRMNNHDQFDGIEFETVEGKDGMPVSVTALIYRKDRTRPTKVTEYLAECRRGTDPWKTSPRRMLRHRALIQCARVAFGFSGADPDEVENMREATGRVIATANVARPKLFSPPAPADGGPGEPDTGDKAEGYAADAVPQETEPEPAGDLSDDEIPMDFGDEDEAPPLRDSLAERLAKKGWPLSIAQIVLTEQGVMENGDRWETLDDDTVQVVFDQWDAFCGACEDTVAKLKAGKSARKGGGK